ncbi:MAG: hypothetical protein J2P17_29035, partial [Mycobacterium sp.]|nr:hypothetical protein [Mycobacterium sp.]
MSPRSWHGATPRCWTSWPPRPAGLCSAANQRQRGAVARRAARLSVSPWANGAHREGTKLSLDEVENFGAMVAEIHNALSA